VGYVGFLKGFWGVWRWGRSGGDGKVCGGGKRVRLF